MLLGLIKYRSHTEREEIAASIAVQSGADLSNSLMMEDNDIRKLHNAGMGIGAHTVDHPILRLCDESEVCNELSGSRDYLEALTDRPVRLFAYPNGKPEIDYTTSQARLVERLGFLAAVSTAPGASGFGDDPFQLRRFTPWDKSRHRFALRLLRNLGN